MRNATVVTGEKAAGTADKPKIPNVCLHYGVPTTSLLGFIREMKWTLQLSPG
ncbi:MAG: DUF4411 family protein [Gemmatimonadetes bacterium]|nr:DUF4411 family protein [Gemmatimonadota bacterium]